MGSLSQSKSESKPAAIYEYFDAAIIWLREPLEGQALVQFEALCEGRLHQRTAPMRFHARYRQCLWLHQPRDEVLAYLATRSDALVTRVEIARDYIFENAADRRHAFETMCSHLIKPYRRSESTRIFVGLHGETLYSGDRSKAFNIVAYQDMPCRITGELYCVHIEARLRTQPMLRSENISTPGDMLTRDKSELLNKRLRFFAIDFEKLGRKIGIATNRRQSDRRGAILSQHRLPDGKTFTYNEDKRRGQIIARKYGLPKEQFVFKAKGASARELEKLRTAQNVVDALKAHKALNDVDVRECLMEVKPFANNGEGNQNDKSASGNIGDIIIGEGIKPHDE